VDDIVLERLKVYQDSFKHMMTFCSGAILLFAAVTGALFLDPKPNAPLLLAFCVVLLTLGALFAMLGLVVVPRRIASGVSTGDLGFMHSLLWASVLAAYSGLANFSLFAVVNLAPELSPF
jgi:hypothetical protein